MNKNSRIASRNYGGNAQAMSRPSAQSNLFGQKNSQAAQHPMQTRSQTSMMMLETPKHYLNQPSGDLRSSPKRHLGKTASKKGSKTKVAHMNNIQMQRSEPHSGGISARSGHGAHAANYSQKTFYSNYIGANSAKGGSTQAQNSQVSSFVEKSRNNSYSTTNMTSNGGVQNRPEMKVSQTQSNLIGGNTSGLVSSLSQTQQHHPSVQHQSSMTLSSSRILTNLQDRMMHEGANNSKSSKAAAAAVAAARVNANINAAAQQNVQKLAVPDLAQKLLKTQMSLDLKGLSKIAQQQKSRAGKAQKSNRAIIPQNKVSIVLNNQNWEQTNTTEQHVPKNEYSMRSISRKRDTKGVNKTKIATREASINSVLQDKHLVDDKNDTMRSKKVAQVLKNSNASAKRKGIQNELLATLNLKSYQKGMVSQQLSAQNSQRAIVSPKQRVNHSFKFNQQANASGVSAFEGLTPKQTSKAFQRVHNRKTDSKLRASKITQHDTTNNCSYNQYGIVEGGTSNSLSNAVLQGYVGGGAHTGYVTSLGHNSPDLISPMQNQSQINFRHSRVQSNVVESFNARQASQSALGLMSSSLHGQKQSTTKGRGSMPVNSSNKAQHQPASKKNQGPTYQQQIQEKIRQLQMKDQSAALEQQKMNLNGTERNVMSVINQINKRMELNNQSAMVGQSSSKKLSSRAAMHKSAQQMHESQHLTTQKMLQEKLIKKAQEKLGGKSLNQNQIRESKTQKDLQPINQGLGSNPQQNQSMTTLTTAAAAKRHTFTEKKKKQSDADIPLGPNGRPLSQIELVGVYKFTRDKQKLRQKQQEGAHFESSPKPKEKGSRGSKAIMNSRNSRGAEYASTQVKQHETTINNNTSSVSLKNKKQDGNSRPASHVRQRMEKAYKQFCDQQEIQAVPNHNASNNLNHSSAAQQAAQSLNKISQQTSAAKAKGSSKTQQQQQQKEKSQQLALAAQREAAQQAKLQIEQEESGNETVQQRKRVGKSASIKRKRSEHEQVATQAALLHAATRHKFKEDGISSDQNMTTENEETIGELGSNGNLQHAREIEYSKRKRREVSEPPRYYQSIRMQKMFNEADLLVLEDRSNSRVRSFKIFDDKRVFPEIYENEEFQPLDKEEKHDECDYDTEPEHVVKARELMLEDLTESIKFYVEEQPLDLVYNIHKKYK